jgi:hypothetical protein
MRSPNEYEAAFYAETPSTNADTLVKVGNPESSLHKAGTLIVQGGGDFAVGGPVLTLLNSEGAFEE